MVTQLSDDNAIVTGGTGQLRQWWYVAVQAVVLGLLALALFWASQPPDPNHPVVEMQRPELQKWQELVRLYRLPLMVFGAASLIAGIIPALRRHPLTGMLGGITLGMACWLSSVHLWELPFFTEVSATIPLIAPVVLGAALLLALLGLITRAGIIRGTSSLGKAALAGMLLLTAASVLCYLAINFAPSLRVLEYEITRDQFWEMLASVLLFLPAIWLGGVAIRREARWCFQPIGTFIVLAVFLVLWKVG